MGLLTQKDATLWRSSFKEMAFLRGISVKYQYVIDTNVSIHAEFKSSLSDPIDLDIVFLEGPPAISTLAKAGWISEKSDDKPYVAILPFDTLNLTSEAVITITPFEELAIRSKAFKITEITTIMEFPDAWTCKLAPIFNTKVVSSDYEESNYNYLDSKDTPFRDTPNTDDNYSFLNVGE